MKNHTRFFITLGSFIVSMLMFVLTYPFEGDIAGMWSTLPAVMSGWFLGMRGALVFGLLSLPSSYILYHLVNSPMADVFANYAVGTVGTISIGMATGWVKELFDRLEKQSYELERERKFLQEEIIKRKSIEEALQTAKDNLESIVMERTAQLKEINEQLHTELAERKRAEEELLKVRLGLDRSQEAVFMTNLDGTIIYCNSAFERVYGFTREEAIGKTPRILKSGLISPEQYAGFWQALLNKQIVAGEITNKTKDGRLIPIEGSNNPILNSDGEIIGFLGIHHDITDRKRAEEAMQESETRYRLIAENASDAIFTMGLDLRFTYVSPAVTRIRGYTVEEVMAQTLDQVLTPASLDMALEIFAKEIEIEASGSKDLGRMRTLELEETCKDGSTVWTETTIRFLRDSENQAIGTIGTTRDITERKRAEEETFQKNNQLATLNQLGRSLSKLATPSEIVERIDEMIGKVFDNRNLYVALYDHATNFVSFPIYRTEGEFITSKTGRPFGNGLTEYVIRTKAPLWIPDLEEEVLADRCIELSDRMSRCYMAVPMLVNDQAIGVIAIQDYECAGVYTNSHLELLSTIASQAAIALENARLYATVQQELNERKRAEEKLTHNAFHDALTDLPNRALFMDRLGRAIERAKRHKEYLFAVLFLDLDRFKVINDSLGHAIGDQLLMETAQRLTQCIRTEDTVARLGGDEFVILLDEITDNLDGMMIADRIQHTLAQPFELGPHRIFISVSIGIVQSAVRYECAEDVLRDADVAMYRAKTLGRGRYEVFDTEMRDRAMTRLELESDLRKALEQREFFVYYQPIVSLITNRIAGFEALVRWQHPTRGLVPPAEFIPMAEETGLIIPIGQWVLCEACRQMRIWQSQFPQEPPLTISVNLSTKQFTQADLIEKITAILCETGLDARSLKLELTESLIVEDSQVVMGMLEQLRALGVQVQIDDFGTGYSSLGYLHRLPIDTLKIDRTFISKMGVNGNGSEIVRTILALAHDLGMQVIAEGVETVEQLSKLREMDCEYGQGYYFTKPVDSQTAEHLITQLPTAT